MQSISPGTGNCPPHKLGTPPYNSHLLNQSRIASEPEPYHNYPEVRYNYPPSHHPHQEPFHSLPGHPPNMYTSSTQSRTLDPRVTESRVAMPVPPGDPQSLIVRRQRPDQDHLKMPVPEVPYDVKSQVMMQQKALFEQQQNQLQYQPNPLQHRALTSHPHYPPHKMTPKPIATSALRQYSDQMPIKARFEGVTPTFQGSVTPSSGSFNTTRSLSSPIKGYTVQNPHHIPNNQPNQLRERHYRYHNQESSGSNSHISSSSSASMNTQHISPRSTHTNGTSASSNGTQGHPNVVYPKPSDTTVHENASRAESTLVSSNASTSNYPGEKIMPSSHPPTEALNKLTLKNQMSGIVDPNMSVNHQRFGSGISNTSSIITVDQFETIRRQAATQLHDPRTQLELARKLFEASRYLADRYTDPVQPSTMKVDEAQQEVNRESWTSQAIKITKKLAAKTQFPDALFLLGSIYSSGLYGFEMNNVKALECYSKAAKLEHAESCYRIAVCVEFGVGTKSNIEKAINWYKKAAMLGNVSAMYKLGMLNMMGTDEHPRNFASGLSWLKRAADLADVKNPHAVYELALLYEHSPLSSYVAGDPIQQNNRESLELFYSAAKLGYAPSQTRIGRAFEYGELGCPIDPIWSISWYSQAAQQGESEAELALAGWYWTGAPNLEKNDAEAYMWAEKSARQGNPKAMYAVGYFTEHGIGVQRNMSSAKKWYMLAAENKNSRAMQKLMEL